MKVKPTDTAKAHLLYSVEDGVDDWTVLGGHGEKGSLSPYIEEGEYGLRGVNQRLRFAFNLQIRRIPL